MERFWSPLSTNIDEDGLEFISTLEAKNYPIFATQDCLFFNFYIRYKKEIIFLVNFFEKELCFENRNFFLLKSV